MEIKGKRVLVTGGAGFIGSHLVDRLVEAGNEVVIVDNFSFGKEENIAHHAGNPQVQVERADIRNRAEMSRLSQGVNVIFHLAVFCLRNALHDPFQAHEINATGSLYMCQAALENKVERFLYVSTGEVYGTALHYPIDENHPLMPTNVYGAAKAAGELYALSYNKTYGLPASIVRLFNTYGPREQSEGRRAEVIPKFVLRTMAGLKPVIFGKGNQSRDFTFVDDIVRGIIMAAECDAMIGQSANLARGQDVSISTLCQMILQKLNRLDLEPQFLHEDRPADIVKIQADVRKAKQIFGYSADTELNSGLDRYIAWVKQQNLDLESWIRQDSIKNW
jgi:UDP-glucose 4-epimerase